MGLLQKDWYGRHLRIRRNAMTPFLNRFVLFSIIAKLFQEFYLMLESINSPILSLTFFSAESCLSLERSMIENIVRKVNTKLLSAQTIHDCSGKDGAPTSILGHYESKQRLTSADADTADFGASVVNER